MKTTLQYVSYFQSLAQSSALIDRFYYGFDEFKENADSADGTILVLEPYENAFSENQNDNNLATRNGFFVVLKPYESDQGREYANVQDACERICYKLIGQMKRDSKANIITLDILNWRGEPAAPVVGNFLGYSISFTYEESLNPLMALDEDDWNSGS